MTSKIALNPKVSTLIIANYVDPKCEGRKKGFTESFMKDYIARSIRETRYYETIQNITSRGKIYPLTLGSQSYDELFKKLVESCRSFFTKEYGKNEEDYNMFVENCTKAYETPIRNECSLVFDRMKFYKYETELKKRRRASDLSMKKSKMSILSRHKSKGEVLKNKVKQVIKASALKRSKSLTRRTKKTKKADVLGAMFERSASDLIDSSEDEIHPVPSREFPKRVKPFIYKLSDPEMIKTGITVNYQLPVRLITLFAYPTCRSTFWFQQKEHAENSFYPDGRLCWHHDPAGEAAVYYDNGEPAISFIFGRTGPLIIVYTKSEKILDRTIKQVPVGLFDLRGNGIVYDKNTGKKRLIFDQAQGILLDSPSGYPIPWKWKSYNRVICRRAELKYIRPTSMDDFDDDKGKALAKMYDLSQRKFKNKRLTSIWEPKKPKKKKSRRSDFFSRWKKRYPSKISSGKSTSATSMKKKPKTNSIIRNIDIPKVIRFVGGGFIIKPILTPCEELEPVKLNVVAICPPMIPLDSAPTSRRPSVDRLTNNSSRRGTGQKSKASYQIDERIYKEHITKCKHRKKHRCLLKPIVLKLTDKVSLTITDQEHVHIDFISPPMHYSFNIGIRVAVEKIDSIYDVRIPKVNKDYIPSVLEALKMKCPILYNINKTITNLRHKVLQKSRRDCIKSLKSWGQDRYLGKVPLCKLMNNKCSCRSCRCIPANIETK